MAKLISVPSSPTEGTEPHLIHEGTLDYCTALYSDWQDGATLPATPRHDALVLVNDSGVPVCAAS